MRVKYGDVRRSPKRALLRVLPDGGERVRDHGHEEVDEPEIEHDDADDEEEARDEELGVHHGVHEGGPLFSSIAGLGPRVK